MQRDDMKDDSKASRLAAELQDHIDGENLKAGTPLGTKSRLLEQHRVAAGTLNEALRLLQVRGYVEVRPGPKGGIFVAEKELRLKLRHTFLEAQDDPKRIAAYLQVREALEVTMVVEAAKACTSEHAEQIEQALEILRNSSGARETILADWDLHRVIARAGANEVLANIYCDLLDMVQASVIGYSLGKSVRPGVSGDTFKVHQDLAAAVIAGDLIGAKQAAILHTPIGISQGSGSSGAAVWPLAPYRSVKTTLV